MKDKELHDTDENNNMKEELKYLNSYPNEHPLVTAAKRILYGEKENIKKE